MEEHYCKIHEVKFFKTAKMRGFAHPIEGTEPTKWCAEEDMDSYHSPDPEKEKVIQQKLKEEPPESTKETNAKPAPQELGMWWKELGEMIRANDPYGLTLRDAYYSQMLSVLPIKIKEAKGETIKDTTDNQETETKPTDRQDSGEAIKTAGELFGWITSKDKNIKVPRAWLEAEYEVSHNEVLTLEKIQKLHKEIIKGKGW